MKHREFTKFLVLFVSPLVTSLSVAASPSLAATFARSEASFTIVNYNQLPTEEDESRLVAVDTNTSTFAQPGSSVTARSDADANFSINGRLSTNNTLSEAFGTGSAYLGEATSLAQVLANFVIEAGQSFSFNFVASLFLNTSIDPPPNGSARSSGGLSLILQDSTTNEIFDFFTVSGNLITRKYEALDRDFLEYQNSQYITVSDSRETSFGENQYEESATGEFVGSYRRTFNSRTNLTLIETKNNSAIVKAPEPSVTLGLFLFVGLTGVCGLKSKLNRQSNLSAIQPNSNL